MTVRRLALNMSAALLLAACATSNPPVAGTPHEITDGLDVTAMKLVIERAFTEIKERAYNEPETGSLFRNALNGLKQIDSNVSMAVRGDDLVVLANGEEIADAGAVGHADLERWTEAAVNAILATRAVSPQMHEADEETFYQVMFAASLSKLDPYSRYASRRDATRNRLVRDGVIGLGIGVEPVPAGAYVLSIVSGGPADLAGIKPGDIILSADGVKLARKPILELRQYLDGSADTLVNLVVKRPEYRKPLRLTARRDLIVPDTVTSSLDDGVLDLVIRSFNQRTSSAVEHAIVAARLQNEGKLKGIVLDFRSDPGGLLDQAIDMADLFLDSGSIIALHGRHPGAQQYYSAHRGDIAAGTPMVVLMDGRSASSAEIVAAALQDNGRAVVVGTVSLGKGSVQTIVRLPNAGEIALTWAHATTPRGAELHGLGVLPDVCLATDITVGQALAQVTGDPGPSMNTRRRWRLPADDAATHDTLRAACPPQIHADREVDLAVAQQLLKSPSLMARAAGPRNGSQVAGEP